MQFDGRDDEVPELIPCRSLFVVSEQLPSHTGGDPYNLCAKTFRLGALRVFPNVCHLVLSSPSDYLLFRSEIGKGNLGAFSVPVMIYLIR